MSTLTTKNFWATKSEELALFFVTKEMIEDQPFQAFRNLLLVGLMLVICVLAVFVGFIHLFLTDTYINFSMNLMGSLYLVFLIYSVHKNKNLTWQPHAFVVLAFLYFPLYVYINQAQDYSLAWLFIVPFSMIAILGRRLGLRYLFLFYLIIFSMAYQALGIWDNGNWNELSLLRFVLASLLGLALALVIDQAQAGLNERLKAQKTKEKGYIKELERLTMIDSLTNVYNRRYLNDVVTDRVKTLSRTDTYLAFFIIDIDYFKHYNDTFGHLAGDEVLIEVAQAIKNYIKRYDDLVFRLGGEEFGGVITTNEPDETVTWLAGLVPHIENLNIEHSPLADLPHLTISVGIYYCHANRVKNISDLYRAADEALYIAKDLGRNRAVLWDAKQHKEVTS